MMLNRCTQFLSVFLAIVAAEEGGCCQEELVDCRISLSGIVSHLLDEQTTVEMLVSHQRWSDYKRKVAEFPITVQAHPEDTALVNIREPGGYRVAAIFLGYPIGSEVNLALSAPRLETRIRKRADNYLRVVHLAWIDAGICYSELPCWDSAADKLVAARSPTLELICQGKRIYVETMEPNNCGFGWRTGTYLRDIPKEAESLIVKITHDTGDLFGVLTSNSVLNLKAPCNPQKSSQPDNSQAQQKRPREVSVDQVRERGTIKSRGRAGEENK